MERQLEVPEQRDQYENQFARKHVAEQTQAQADRLGEQSHALEYEIERDDDGRGDQPDAACRRCNRV